MALGDAAPQQQDPPGVAQIPFTTKPGNYYLGTALDIQSRVNELSNENNYAFSANTINVPQRYNPTSTARTKQTR